MKREPMRFCGVSWPHNPRVLRFSAEKTLVEQQSPGSGTVIQETGRRALRVEGEGELYGENCVAQFGELGIHVTSGNVEAALSAVPGFTGKFSVTSGRVDTQMPLAKSGDTYTCGDGSGKLTISTTSGNILVKEIP